MRRALNRKKRRFSARVVGDRASFDHLVDCAAELKEHVPAGCPAVLVGNKVDLGLASIVASHHRSSTSYQIR